MTLPPHLFIGDSTGGALYDTRVAQWSRMPPLRPNYERHHRDIATIADLKATLRAGPCAWPGGYPLYFMCSDGEALSFASVRENLREIMSAIRDRDNSGWHIVACEVNHEDTELVCAHSGERIESAYGETETEES